LKTAGGVSAGYCCKTKGKQQHYELLRIFIWLKTIKYIAPFFQCLLR
jgi:hypothetical protein